VVGMGEAHAGWDMGDHWSMFLSESTPEGQRTESIQAYRFRDRLVLFMRGYVDGDVVEVAVPLTADQLREAAESMLALCNAPRTGSDTPGVGSG
jgi:hypothetical protein